MDKWISTGLAIALVAVIAILGLPALRHLSEAPPAVQPPLRFSLAAPAGAELGAGDEILDAAISPDERQIVFVATTDGTTRLWLRELRGDQIGAVAGNDGARLPAWKQTGNVVSFFTDGRLKEITIATGRSCPRSGECQCRVRCVVAARRVAAVCTRRPRRDSSSAERRRD